MALVHKEPVNAQLLKGDYIVLTLIGAQFFQLGFQRFPGLFHLLDGEILACVDFQLIDGGKRFINLLLNNTLLPLKGQRNALKLAVPNDDSIVVAGGDAGAEFCGLRSQNPCAVPPKVWRWGRGSENPMPIVPSDGWALRTRISGTAPAVSLP